jgi:GDP/UDP-N,N'-diacetylbacillosamine 2-epimerase (hydrolysing)
MRTIAVVTGTRAEYGPLRPLMKAIQNDPDLTLVPIITGMHLLPDYGNTYRLVEKEFPRSVKIPMPLHGDSLKDMALYLAAGIKNFSEYLSKHPPDILIVTGDRSEQFAAALAALYLNIPIAHINGGDVSGGMIDEAIRHAITKIAHIHLAYNDGNKERIKKMGEDPWRVKTVGPLAVEAILDVKVKSKKDLFTVYQLNPKVRTFLVVQHPITTLKDRGYQQYEALLSALDQLQEQTILVYPNCDAGSRHIITLIKKFENRPYLHIFKNIPPDDYVGFMKYADILLGNSSSGIIEAPALKTRVINIGDRQQGRTEQYLSDIIKTIPATEEKIITMINYVLNNAAYQAKVRNSVNKYKKEKPSKKIVSILKKVPLDEKLIRKQITY